MSDLIIHYRRSGYQIRYDIKFDDSFFIAEEVMYQIAKEVMYQIAKEVMY
jgi:hypothetical protein